jgi:UBA/TS-N domain
MFRRIRDGLSAAANALAGSDEQGVQALQSMGFSGPAARNALQATNGNVEQADKILLAANGVDQHQPQQQQQQAALTEAALNAALQENILSREWSLMDINRYPLAPIDCEEE